MRRFLLLFAACCGLAATQASARKPVVTDTVATADGARLTMAEHGEIALINIFVPPGARPSIPAAGSRWEIKVVGTDRYGRALALLTHPGEKTTLQEDWLRAGQAIAYSPVALPKKFMEAEEEARAARRGIWAADRTLSPQEAGEHLQQFALVEGAVTRTYKARNAYYINFGEDWKTDFSITVPRIAWRSFKDQLEVSPGTRLRVRGAVISENGPMITVTRPEQLERL